ncbi:hypothetical protein EW146_g4493 [Bondarzewia mesenterica]|uniref:Auxin efflux carrier n=1 Tax=Bondarzewia mesenterica TaxID=1095465 RepID=A0A4S4LW85_9AGAM|nr:hypothetical protein EW146_g4493 [Bondarzewia mesenterica]
MTCHHAHLQCPATSKGILDLPESRWRPMTMAVVTSSPLMHQISSESILERGEIVAADEKEFDEVEGIGAALCLVVLEGDAHDVVKLLETYAEEGNLMRTLQAAIRIAAYQHAEYVIRLVQVATKSGSSRDALHPYIPSCCRARLVVPYLLHSPYRHNELPILGFSHPVRKTDPSHTITLKPPTQKSMRKKVIQDYANMDTGIRYGYLMELQKVVGVRDELTDEIMLPRLVRDMCIRRFSHSRDQPTLLFYLDTHRPRSQIPHDPLHPCNCHESMQSITYEHLHTGLSTCTTSTTDTTATSNSSVPPQQNKSIPSSRLPVSPVLASQTNISPTPPRSPPSVPTSSPCHAQSLHLSPSSSSHPLSKSLVQRCLCFQQTSLHVDLIEKPRLKKKDCTAWLAYILTYTMMLLGVAAGAIGFFCEYSSDDLTNIIMLSAGTLIWVSLRPLIRLFLVVASGFALTKADLFPAVAARGTGQVMLNIALPCLMFSRIVPAFSSDNIASLDSIYEGPLILVAFIYEGLGLIIAWIIKQFFWVPHQFRYGILVAGIFGNTGDIPTSVIMSITGVAPFNGSSDQTLSVAYISAFILVFFVTLFPAGDEKAGDVEDSPVQEKKYEIDTSSLRDDNIPAPILNQPSPTHSKHVSFHPDDGTTIVPPTSELNFASRVASPAPTITQIDGVNDASPFDSQAPPVLASDSAVSRSTRPRTTRQKVLSEARIFVSSLGNPASVTIILAFPIALINPVKALFIAVPGSSIPNAPDGQPPLAFIMDTASFVAGASVPLGLVCLGSALARLKMPRGDWASIPRGAIVSLAVGRMIVMPVIGVLIVNGLTGAGVINKDDKVLQFVCMCVLKSCVLGTLLIFPTTQVFLTQVFSGTGSAEHLSAFLIPQYIIMFVSMTALTAYTLQSLF